MTYLCISKNYQKIMLKITHKYGPITVHSDQVIVYNNWFPTLTVNIYYINIMFTETCHYQIETFHSHAYPSEIYYVPYADYTHLNQESHPVASDIRHNIESFPIWKVVRTYVNIYFLSVPFFSSMDQLWRRRRVIWHSPILFSSETMHPDSPWYEMRHS